jgi:hypothetical protein
MGTDHFVFDITDYDGTTVLLKKMLQCMEGTVKLYRDTKGLPAKYAPGWKGDAQKHLENIMEEYAAKAKALQVAAESLSKAAMDFIQKRKKGDEEFMQHFKGMP